MLAGKGPGFRHISYWLSHFLPDFTLYDGPRALTGPPWLYRHMRDLLLKAVGGNTERRLLGMTAKELYAMLAIDLPVPRLEQRSPATVELVWPRLATPTLGVQARHTMFCLVNKIFRNKEAMFREWGRGDPTCDFEPDIDDQCSGIDSTPEHIFTRCGRTAEAWEWVRNYIFSTILPPHSATDQQFLSLTYPRQSMSKEDSLIWLLGSFLRLASTEAVDKQRVISVGELRGHLRQELQAYGQKKMKPIFLPRL